MSRFKVSRKGFWQKIKRSNSCWHYS